MQYENWFECLQRPFKSQMLTLIEKYNLDYLIVPAGNVGLLTIELLYFSR